MKSSLRFILTPIETKKVYKNQPSRFRGVFLQTTLQWLLSDQLKTIGPRQSGILLAISGI